MVGMGCVQAAARQKPTKDSGPAATDTELNCGGPRPRPRACLGGRQPLRRAEWGRAQVQGDEGTRPLGPRGRPNLPASGGTRAPHAHTPHTPHTHIRTRRDDTHLGPTLFEFRPHSSPRRTAQVCRRRRRCHWCWCSVVVVVGVAVGLFVVLQARVFCVLFCWGAAAAETREVVARASEAAVRARAHGFASRGGQRRQLDGRMEGEWTRREKTQSDSHNQHVRGGCATCKQKTI